MDCFLIVVDCVFVRIIGCSFLSSSFFLCIGVGLFFCCIPIMVCVLVHNNCPELRQGQADYAFRAYGEFCNFVYCLLSKTRSTSGLPEILKGSLTWMSCRSEISLLFRAIPFSPVMTWASSYPQARRKSMWLSGFIVDSLLIV